MGGGGLTTTTGYRNVNAVSNQKLYFLNLTSWPSTVRWVCSPKG